MRRYISALLIVLVLMQTSAFLNGCDKVEPTLPDQSTDLPAALPTTTDAPSLEENIYREDYQQFWEILETDYPFLPWLADNGTDIDAIRAKYEAQLDQIQDTMEFFDLIQSVCDDLDKLGHLWPVGPERYQSLYSIYCEYPEYSTLPELWIYRKMLTDPGLSPIYQPASQTEGQQAPDADIPDVKVTYYQDCKALCLTIDSFKTPVLERDQNVLTDALREYPDAEHIIFDITGNGGGDDSYWRNNLVLPLGGNPQAMGGRVFYRSTPFLAQYYYTFDYASVPVSELKDVPDWVGEMKLDRCNSWEGVETQTPDAGTETIPGSNARRWVLVSPTVYSSAEKFTIFCQYTGWATVVGSPTGGDGIGGSPVYAKLDQTGLLFQFTGMVGENPVTGMPSACQGTIPDYIADDALEACLELIRGGVS